MAFPGLFMGSDTVLRLTRALALVLEACSIAILGFSFAFSLTTLTHLLSGQLAGLSPFDYHHDYAYLSPNVFMKYSSNPQKIPIDSDAELVGVLLSSDNDNLALIKMINGRANLYKAGEKLPNDAVIESIEKNMAVLSLNGHTVKLNLKTPRSGLVVLDH